MTIETASAGDRLRPRILEIEETGRLDLSLPPAPEPSLALYRTRAARPPFISLSFFSSRCGRGDLGGDRRIASCY